MAVRPDLRLVAAARWDRRVELFDGKTGKSLNRLVCHDDSVLSVTFEATTGRFASAGADGRIALWNLFSDTYLGPVGALKDGDDGYLTGTSERKDAAAFAVSTVELADGFHGKF
eukprot:symbB.v1.2.014602.t1/scaffold1071.1/size202461/15